MVACGVLYVHTTTLATTAQPASGLVWSAR
jgi:hypothetical protein